MHGVFEDLLRGGQLHDPSQVHDRDAVRNVLHHGQVMGNEDVGQFQLFLEPHQQIENLGLDGHIQRRDRLVADHHLRVDQQGAGDPDPLPLAPRKLMGIAIHVLRAHVHRLQDVGNECTLIRLVDYPEMPERVGQRLINCKRGVQGGIGVLKNDLDAAMQDLFVLPVQVPQVLFTAVLGAEIVHHRSISSLDQLDDGFAQCGLTAAGLPYQPQSLPLVDVQVHVVDRLHMVPDLVEKPAPNWEKGLHPPQLQQHFFLAHTASTSSLCPA